MAIDRRGSRGIYLILGMLFFLFVLSGCASPSSHPAIDWSLSDGRWEVHAEERRFLGYSVHSLVVDTEGNLWAGTLRGGGRFDGATWEIIAEYPVAVWGIDLDSQGRAWLADGYGVEVYDHGSRTTYGVEDGMTSIIVQEVMVDSQARVWVGLTATEYQSYGGIELFEDGQWRHIDTSDLFGSNVLALAEDASGNIWAGGSGGLARFDGTAWEPLRLPDQSAAEVVSSIATGPSGRIWVGTTRSGLWIQDSGTWNHYGEEDGLAGDLVWAIAFDGAGRAWIGTSSGLSAFDGETWATYTVEDGLLFDDVRSLAAAEDGIWVGTWRGLCRLIFDVGDD